MLLERPYPAKRGRWRALTMRRIVYSAIVVSALTWGCGASYPPPTQSLADVQAADRSAKELGARSLPQAELHLHYAEEQTSQAGKLMENGDNERAAALLTRAKADAELAVALAHEQRAKTDVEEARAKTKINANANQGVGR
jgi:hypothetical protein